jgi:hypothetical protein
MSASPDLRSAAQATIAQAWMSGMVIFALSGDGPIEVIAIGNDVAGVALDPDTLFSVASGTKLATATHIPGGANLGDSPDSAESVSLTIQADPGVVRRLVIFDRAGRQI